LLATPLAGAISWPCGASKAISMSTLWNKSRRQATIAGNSGTPDLECSCHVRAMLLPWSCYAFAMFLPCSCHALAGSSTPTPTTTTMTPCSCHVLAMLFPCYCHAPATHIPRHDTTNMTGAWQSHFKGMSRTCQYHGKGMSNSCHDHDNTTSIPDHDLNQSSTTISTKMIEPCAACMACSCVGSFGQTPSLL
jgi:hypothetical protein